MIITAIVLATAAALCLALGTHLQRHAVAALPPGLRRRSTWVAGLGLMGLVTVLNVIALGLGPVSIVQPIGAVSLVFAALISRSFFALRLGAPMLAGIAVTLVGIFAFVATSARFSHELVVSEQSVTWLLAVLVALSLFAGAFSIGSAGHIPRVVMTGIVFGTVAAAVHVLARSVIVAGLPGLVPLGVRWWMLVGAVGLASVAGFWLVQTAYARGPAETVLAGLTVIDPIVAVIIGAAFFGEYTGLTAAATAGLLASAAVGAGGVWMLSRFHPTVLAARTPSTEASASVTETNAPSAPSETLQQGTRS